MNQSTKFNSCFFSYFHGLVNTNTVDCFTTYCITSHKSIRRKTIQKNELAL